MEETAAALVGFYPAFSPLFPPTPFSLFLSLFSLPLFFLYQTTLSFTYPSLCVYPACLCSKCTYCPCLPLLPSPLTPEQFPAVPHTQGPVCTREEKKKNFCVTNDAAQCILFQYRKKSDSYLKIFFVLFFFLCVLV